jgi:hypothetical protein
MIELESLRLLAAASMLSVASYYDLRTREVGDLIWVIFGSCGAILYVFDWNVFFPNAFFGLLCGLTLASLLSALRLCGKADIFAIVALSTILPAYNETPVVLSALIGFFLASTYSVADNICKNTSSIIRGTGLFSEIKEPAYRKILAFFVMHKRADNERHGFSGISQENKFVFKHDHDAERFLATDYVTSTMPLMPFFLGGLILFSIFKSAQDIL